MDPLDHFHRLCAFDPAARPPRWETLGFWPQTVQRWRREGLPPGVNPDDYFTMHPRQYLPGSCGFTGLPFEPVFEKEVLSEDEETLTYRSSGGIVMRELKQDSELSMPQWISFPVKNREDWEAIRFRLDATTRTFPQREDVEREIDLRYPVGYTVCGFYGTPRNLFGEEVLAYTYYDDPGLIHDIARHWLAYCIHGFDVMVERVRIDYLLFWEDMAFKTGPLIGPDLFREFMLPYYVQLIEHVRGRGVSVIKVDSDGNNDVLMELFLGAGVDMMMPFEIAADQDPREARERYGNRLVIVGGLDKRAIAAGGESLEREVLDKVPRLLEYGGYIPTLDHSTPPDISLANHARFVELIRDCVERQCG